MKRKEILNHLASGIQKQIPEVFDEIKNEIRDLEDNSYREDSLRSNICNSDKKRNRLKKLSIATAACLTLLLTFTFTPARAYIENSISKIFGNAYHDKGVSGAIDKGIGQVINQSHTDNGVTVNINGIINDANRSVLLLSLNSQKTNLKDATIDSIQIMDRKGKSISTGGIMRYSYDNKKNERKIVYSIEPLSSYLDKNIILKINKINTNNNKESLSEFNTGIQLNDKSVNNLEKDFDKIIPYIESFVIRRYQVTEGEASIEIEYKIKEEYKDSMVFFKLVYEKGQELETINEQIIPFTINSNNDQSSKKVSAGYQSYKLIGRYHVENNTLATEGINVIANCVNTNNTSINGNWSFDFNLEKANLDGNYTKKLEINKNFSYNGKTYKIERVVFSASETRVYIKSDNGSPAVDIMKISLKTDDAIISCNHYFKGEDGIQVYCFEPSVGYENTFQIAEDVKVLLCE